MSKNKYDNAYDTFLKENFPSSFICGNRFKANLYSRVWENNVIAEIFEEKLTVRGNSCALVFLTAYKEQITKLLLYFPLNDNAIIDFAIRCSVEYLLKLIYSIKVPEEDIMVVSNKGYTELKNELKPSLRGTFIEKNLNDLFQKYGNYSNRVHSKSIEVNRELSHLQNMISCKQIDYTKFDKIFINILDDFEVILSYFLLEGSYCLSTPKLITLSKGVDSARICRIKQNLSYNQIKKVAGD